MRLWIHRLHTPRNDQAGERFGLEGELLFVRITSFISEDTPRNCVSARFPKMLSARCSAGHVLSTISMTRPEDMWVCVD